ncbi:MAG TPA: hypothetical protein GX401_09580 [Clostridiales bacterium]|nr:hypothetical protein [Clostridiales bacterium]
MKCREFVSIGEPIPELSEKEHAAFFLLYQRSILDSLKKRELLSHFQYERCIEELEKQYSTKNHSQA